MLGADLCAEAVAGGMTCAAMTDAICQVGAAVPLLVLLRVRVIRTFMQEEKFPSGKNESHIQRKREVVFRDLRLDGLPRHYEGIQRCAIRIVEQRKVVIREGGIEVLTFAI